MNKLYFAPGACSFVPHVALEVIKAATGEDFEPAMVRLHKGEHRTPEYLALNPNGQVPMLVVDGKPLVQIQAIVDYLDRRYPAAQLLPTDPWARAQAMSVLAWMNNTVHPTFTHIFKTEYFAGDDASKAEVKRVAIGQYRGHLERIQGYIANANPYWFGAHVTVHDAYAFTFMRWAGYAGIDPEGFPAYQAYLQRVMAAAPVATVLTRERIALDTYKKAA